jgi:predicted ATPase/DNA-binding SARP family transcriptional activator
MLALHANQPITAERLVTAVWGEDAPRQTVRTVHAYVSRLRAALADDTVLISTAAGYRLRVGPQELDSSRFERLLAEARDAAPGDAYTLLGDALSLWRGEPLVDVAFAPFANAEIARLDELRLAAIEVRADAALALDQPELAIAELQSLAAAHPDREELARRLMIALYRLGRHAEALAVFRRTRAYLADALGLEPSPELRGLEQSVLNHDADLRGSAPQPPPSPASPLVGRDEDTRAVLEMLSSPDIRLVTLIGPGGVGKTRLAIEVARRAARPSAWIELAGVEHVDDVPAALVQGLGVQIQPGESAEQALTRFLVPKQLLLVADNLEHLPAAALLVGRLLAAAAGLTILATSRAPLSLASEHRYPVAPLEIAAAAGLFASQARRSDPCFRETRAVAEICQRLDRLPLAIELAAARTSLFSPDQLLRRLDDALLALGRGPRDAPDRQRTLRATLEWSHRLLDPDQQAAFAAFGVFAGGAEVDDAELVTGADADALQALVDKQLLQRAGSRLTMLETVRAFALERLPEGIRGRHLRHYLALAERARQALNGPDEATWIARLDREADNLRGALSWSIERAPETSLRLAGVLGRYWYITNCSEGRRWTEATLEAAGDRAPVRDRAIAHSELAFVLNEQGTDATATAQMALALAQAAGDVETQCAARTALATAASKMHADDQAAIAHARRALDDATAAGLQWRAAQAHKMLAELLPAEQAGPHLEQAIAGLRRSESRWFLGTLYCNLAYRAIAERRYGDALAQLEPAVALLKPRYARLAALVWGNVGLARLLGGCPQDAAAPFARELRFAAQQVSPPLAAESLAGFAALSAHDGAFDRCAVLLGAAQRIGPIGEPDVAAELQRRFYAPAQHALGTSKWDAAIEAGGELTLPEAVAIATDRGAAERSIPTLQLVQRQQAS